MSAKNICLNKLRQIFFRTYTVQQKQQNDLEMSTEKLFKEW